jgi:iron complex transport system substrate-binding protein
VTRRRFTQLGTAAFALLSSLASAEVAVVDDTGRHVVLAAPAERIVTLAPHATELVFAAGAGAKLIAVEAASDYPAAAGRLPRVGAAGALDRERLLRLAPDLVVAWHSGNRASDLAWLERQAIAVYRTEPTALDDIASALRRLGALAGTAAKAEAAAAEWESALARACRPGQRRRALVVLWERPLMTYGGSHWINDLLTRAGYDNVFAGVARDVFAPAPEAVLAARAEVVLTTFPAPPEGLGVPAVLHLPAAASRPSPRLAEVLARICVGDTVTGSPRPPPP